jgi:hypothetical protein
MNHFAASNDPVHMTIKLEGHPHAFLPFNTGDNGAQGKPPNPILRCDDSLPHSHSSARK